MPDPAGAPARGPHSPCRVCGSAEATTAQRKQDVAWVRCAGCGTVRQHPYPTPGELERFYARYVTHKTATSVYLTPAGRESFRRDKLKTFDDLGLGREFLAGVRVLDVGCATGDFLRLAAELGAERTVGIDVSEECVALARADGLEVEQLELAQVRQTFDVVAAWHVIEHVPDPVAFAADLARVTRDGGLVLLETPVYGEIAAAFGAEWRYLLPWEHVHLFEPATLDRILLAAGLVQLGAVRFGSGNGEGTVPPHVKRAMDSLAKTLGIGDTRASAHIKRARR